MESIGWQWDETDHPDVCTDFGDGSFVFTHNDDLRTAEIRRIKGDSRWAQTISDTTADSAVLVVHDERLYVALYSRGLTGCRVLALDLGSGERLWDTTLTGIGSIGHSKYANQVQMRIRGEWVLIFGSESGGRYIEILDSSTGQLIFNRRV